jgi:rod shape-determining protein MreC
MRNLIDFFKRFRIFLVFAVLQGVALSTYFTFMSFPRSQYLTSASKVNGEILSWKNEFTKHFNLAYNNTRLQKANLRLRENLPMSLLRLSSALVKVDDTLYRQQYQYMPATVINSTHDKRNNYFTLNAGSSQGIRPGMGVFSDYGIVGIVYNVSDHFSVVKSVLTEAINIDVMMESSDEAFGLLKWDGKDARIGSISGISNDMRIKRWDRVVTRGGSAIFPKGLPVGKVSKIGTIEGKPLWDISVLFSEDYRKIQRVYVIKNLLKTEQEKIESLIPVDKEEGQ